MSITQTLKERSLELIESATSLSDVAYLVKGLSDGGNLDTTLTDAVEDKLTALAPTSNAKDIAYLTKALENASNVQNEDIYKIGKPGEIGFGVATCPPDLLPSGWVGLDGHDRIGSPNYGNYQDLNGSVLFYVPKHYFKIVGNEMYVSDNPASGYVIDRAFINGGSEIHGIFFYKYIGTNIGGKLVSVKNTDPVSCHSAHNPISALSTAPANNMGGFVKAVKSAGNDYCNVYAYHWAMLARLAYMHGKASTSTATCAYIDVNPKMPKGCHISALRDVNDSSVTYASSGYSDCGLTGSGTPFAKTTHNGQDCGMADMNGLMYEFAPGFTLMQESTGDTAVPEPTDFLTLQESIDIRNIVDDSEDAGTGLYDIGLYDQLDLTGLVDGNDGWVYFGNGTEQVFGMDTDRTTSTYKKTAFGIPLDDGISSGGTTEFGNDGFYRYLRNDMACRVGGYWSDSSNAGVFVMFLGGYRTISYSNIGGRACYLV